MPEQTKRKRGAPPGNRNALKHGYYSRAFKKAEKIDFNAAAGMDGINEEIALLRFEIKKAVSGGDIKNLVPLVKATEALEKLIRTHHKLYQGNKSKQIDLEEALANVYRNIVFPMLTSPANKSSLTAEDFKPFSRKQNNSYQKTNNPENEAA
jgi:hypothetical protein